MAEYGVTYTLKDDGGVGTVKIAGEVVAVIAGLAATEVRGVSSLAGGITGATVARWGLKSLGRGIRITVDGDNSVSVDLALNLMYGYGIPEVGAQVQQKVKDTIETMTGMHVTQVNVHVADIAREEEAKRK